MDRPRQVSGHTPSGQDLTQLEIKAKASEKGAFIIFRIADEYDPAVAGWFSLIPPISLIILLSFDLRNLCNLRHLRFRLIAHPRHSGASA